MIRRIQLAPIVLALGLVSGSAHAALQGRDLNGSLGSFEAYYDTDLNITWLADANHAKTSGYLDNNTDGWMYWAAANTWATNLTLVDAVNNITYDNWRLPSVVDTGTPGCNFAYTGTDCGWNVDTATGEMAHLFYDELGNKAYWDTSANAQSGWGLTNTGPFTNLQALRYWSGTEDASGPYRAWNFNFATGDQGNDHKTSASYALAVSNGDVGVAAVPVPAAVWLLSSGLLGLVGVARRRV